MENKKKIEGSEKKMKYVEPELVSLDKNKVGKGGVICSPGSGDLYQCADGASGPAL